MLEDKRSVLCVVTLDAGFVFAHQRGAAAFDCGPLVWIVAVGAADPPFEHRMGMWQVEGTFLVQMALEASVRILPGVDDLTGDFAAVFGMERAGAVAGLATDVQPLGRVQIQAGMGGTMEIPGDGIVAIRALFGADITRSCDFWRAHDGAVDRHASGHGRGDEDRESNPATHRNGAVSGVTEEATGRRGKTPESIFHYFFRRGKKAVNCLSQRLVCVWGVINDLMFLNVVISERYVWHGLYESRW